MRTAPKPVYLTAYMFSKWVQDLFLVAQDQILPKTLLIVLNHFTLNKMYFIKSWNEQVK